MSTIIERIEDSGVVAVIRASSKQQALLASKACVKGGIKAIEVTFTIADAEKVIRLLKEEFIDSDVLIGAGTVIDKETAIKAINEKASFIVGPNFDKEVLKLCKENNIPYMPGCLTITEIVNAIKNGCEVIKIFPGSLVGPSYLKAVHGPLPNVKLMPTGGVNIDNVDQWIKNGACCVGIGGELTSPMKTGDYDEITRRAKEFIQKVKNEKNKR